MPLRAILSASLLGATAKAVGTIDQFFVDQILEAHREVLHTFGSTDSNRIGQLGVFAFEDQFLTIGVKVMISTVGTRPTPGLMERRSF